MFPLAAKILTFDGEDKLIFGSILRIATTEDKERCKVDITEAYLVVDFKYGNTEYRGLWRQSECSLL